VSLTVGELNAYLRLDDKDFEKGIDKAGKTWGGFSTALKAGIVGAAAVAGTALAGFAAIVHTGIGEIMDASAGTAQLEAGIKSTGGAAGVSVKHMQDLAGAIQAYSGQTDDSIVQTEQLLLTFTKIQNVGADKIFDQATIAAADMAAKLGGDASASAIQLGKALNDPVKGVTALQRVGVSFTEAQKEQIKTMVEAGDVMGAQKIILAELAVEFGGAAAAAGGSLPGILERLKRLWEDFSQTIMAKAEPAIRAFGNAILEHKPQIDALADVLANKVGKVFEWLTNSVLPKVTSVFSSALDSMGQGAGTMGGLFGNLVGIMGAVRDVMTAAWPIIAGVVKSFVDWLSGPAGQALMSSLLELVGQAAQAVQQIFQLVWPVVQQVVQTFIDFLNSDQGQKLISTLLDLVGMAANLLLEVFQRVWPIIQGVVETFINFLNSDSGQKLINNLLNLIVAAADLILTTFEKVWPLLQPPINAFITFLNSPAVKRVLEEVFQVFSQVIEDLAPLIERIFTAIGPILDAAAPLIIAALKPITLAFEALSWLIDKVMDGWDWLQGDVKSTPGDGTGQFSGGGTASEFGTGGMPWNTPVPVGPVKSLPKYDLGGPISDTGPAIVHEGEYMLTRQDVRQISRALRGGTQSAGSGAVEVHDSDLLDAIKKSVAVSGALSDTVTAAVETAATVMSAASDTEASMRAGVDETAAAWDAMVAAGTQIMNRGLDPTATLGAGDRLSQGPLADAWNNLAAVGTQLMNLGINPTTTADAWDAMANLGTEIMNQNVEATGTPDERTKALESIDTSSATTAQATTKTTENTSGLLDGVKKMIALLTDVADGVWATAEAVSGSSGMGDYRRSRAAVGRV
jgi:hypothetical protein